MLITAVFVAGSVALTGANFLLRQARLQLAPRQPVTAYAGAGGVSVSSPPVVQVMGSADLVEGEQRQATLAAVAVGFAAGGLLFPPLTLVSMPLTVITTAPILSTAWQAIFVERRLKPSVVNSALVIGLLLTDHYLPAAALSWLHHSLREVGQRFEVLIDQFQFEQGGRLADLLRQLQGEAPLTVWIVSDGAELRVPFAGIQPGDAIVVHDGELAPVDGVVIDGAATVELVLLTGSTQSLQIGVGDHLPALALVRQGRIVLRVETLPDQPTNMSEDGGPAC